MGDLTDAIVAKATAAPTKEALAVMRISVLDWIACGIAGRVEPVSLHVANMLDHESGARQSTCFDGVKRPARAAALYNGTASHALDYDDTHFAHIGHVSVGILPAALAMADLHGASVDAFLRAGLAGCEGAVRMGVALGREHYQIGFHQTATAGTFGATLAASVVSGANPAVLVHALGLASTKAAGLKSQFGTMGKPYNAGLAASTGVEATQLAGYGMLSNTDGWDGAGGFIATHHGTADLGPVGFLMPQVSHKFHACCHGLHATLEALESLKPTSADTIQSIMIKTHPRWMTVCNKQNPTTGLETKFSYRAVVAMSVLGISTAALNSYTEAVVERADVQDLMQKVTVQAAPELTEMQAMVALTTSNGSLVAHHDLDAIQPLAEREKRVLDKARALIGAERADNIANVIAADGKLPIDALTQYFGN